MDAFGNLVSVVEPDPSLGNVTTNYTYDILNHLTVVSVPRGTNTQTRTFNYNSGTTVTGFLQSAFNPENGTVTYTYGNGLLATKTDAKNQKLIYAYDGYNRLTSVTLSPSTVLRSYTYDAPLYGFTSQYPLGRLTAVTYPLQANGTTQLIDTYSYTQAGLPAAKLLQVNENVSYGGQYGTATANIESDYQYNNEGKITLVSYPDTENPGLLPGQSPYKVGPAYNYSYDSMYRLSGMTDSNNNTIVSNVSYNAGNQLLTMNYPGASEVRGYNMLNQLTTLSAGTENLTYNYPTGTNNGKVSSMYNAVSGETVTYTYDSLNRLLTGSGAGGSSNWGQQYGFDAFGNLLSKTVTAGSGPSLSVSVNPSNNEIQGVSGLSYDPNGNASTSGMTYDAENRLATAGGLQYLYDGQNERIWSWSGEIDGSGNPTGYSVSMYSPNGQKLATYQLTPTWLQGYTPAMWMQVTLASSDQYFGGRRLAVLDQLGSVGTYFPWGEDKGSTNPQNTWSYATYWRDAVTNLDYANNRYYSNIGGRFMTPDPYHASGAPSDPQSWNRYGYTAGDPVNRLDPNGLDYTIPCGDDDEDCGGVVDINQNVCITIDNLPNPFCGYPIYGFQGNGGGASGPKLGIAHSPGSNVGPAGYSGALALLKNPSANCLKDLNAASANAASTTLQGSTIDYTLGVWPTVDASGNVTSGTPAQSYSSKSGNFIDLNLNFGWMTPTNVLINGPNGPFYENYLADVGQSIGVPNLTNTQYWELVLLHELGHILGVPQEPPGGAYNTAIFNDCIKGH